MTQISTTATAGATAANLPSVLLTSGAGGTSEPPLSRRAAAAILGTPEYRLPKLLDSGFLPSLHRADIAPLVGAQFVSTAARELPVAQYGPMAVDGTWRPYTGVSPTMTDSEFVEALRGDWTATPVDACLAAGVLCGGVGDFLVGAILIGGVDPTPKSDPRTTRFEAKLLARLDGPLGSGSISFGAHTTPAQRAWAANTLGRRFLPAAGGAITKI